eukprot:gnl/Ergobibamus_cyprinoides/3613.p1 GENE.gnl/Ergobibamus_cyprinoides/3613~~gnl/Ergobibamus_cyprinoides/3613.p1  ORF type:complete len:174 (+),score=30.16 gnl/Ergobibamus_cyprinoides/3613:319-840(+)
MAFPGLRSADKHALYNAAAQFANLAITEASIFLAYNAATIGVASIRCALTYLLCDSANWASFLSSLTEIGINIADTDDVAAALMGTYYASLETPAPNPASAGTPTAPFVDGALVAEEDTINGKVGRYTPKALRQAAQAQAQAEIAAPHVHRALLRRRLLVRGAPPQSHVHLNT